MNKDTSVIPKGFYCYDYDKKEYCPYHGIDENLPEQENGTCSFLETNDWEINGGDSVKDITALDGRKVDADFGIDEKTGLQAHFPMSLLWDSCKECGENMDDE